MIYCASPVSRGNHCSQSDLHTSWTVLHSHRPHRPGAHDLQTKDPGRFTALPHTTTQLKETGVFSNWTLFSHAFVSNGRVPHSEIPREFRPTKVCLGCENNTQVRNIFLNVPGCQKTEGGKNAQQQTIGKMLAHKCSGDLAM